MMSNSGAKMGLRRPPFAFTEYGALMAASILNSPSATDVSVYAVRAFIRLRELLATSKDLAVKLDALERNGEPDQGADCFRQRLHQEWQRRRRPSRPALAATRTAG